MVIKSITTGTKLHSQTKAYTNKNDRYLIQCARRASGLVLIGYSHCQKIAKPNNLKVFGSRQSLKIIDAKDRGKQADDDHSCGIYEAMT